MKSIREIAAGCRHCGGRGRSGGKYDAATASYVDDPCRCVVAYLEQGRHTRRRSDRLELVRESDRYRGEVMAARYLRDSDEARRRAPDYVGLVGSWAAAGALAAAWAALVGVVS